MKRWQRIFAMAVLLGCLVGLAGLAQSRLVLVDDRGQEVTVSLPVKRIVVTLPLYAEILVDLGAADLLVGITDSPDNPPELAQVPRVGPSFPGPSVEAVLALAPDLVLGAVAQVRERLEAAGLVVLTPVGFLTSLGDLFALVRALGAVTSRPVEAELLLGRIGQQVVELEGRVLQEPPVPTAFLFASGTNPPFAAGKGSLEGELLVRAGGRNVFADVPGGGVVSFEAVLERDPEVIFTDPSQVAALGENPLLAEVAAVRAGKVFGIKASSLTSTRVAAALEAMARALHPEAFPE